MNDLRGNFMLRAIIYAHLRALVCQTSHTVSLHVYMKKSTGRHPIVPAGNTRGTRSIQDMSYMYALIQRTSVVLSRTHAPENRRKISDAGLWSVVSLALVFIHIDIYCRDEHETLDLNETETFVGQET